MGQQAISRACCGAGLVTPQHSPATSAAQGQGGLCTALRPMALFGMPLVCHSWRVLVALTSPGLQPGTLQ